MKIIPGGRKMGFAKFILLSVFLSSAVFASQSRYYVLPSDHVKLLNDQAKLKVISKNNMSLVQLTPLQVMELSGKLHGGYSICGGFTDVQVQMESKNLTLEQAFQWAITRPAVSARYDKLAPTYPKQVEQSLALINQPRFEIFMKDLVTFPDRYSNGDNGVKASKWLAEKALALAKAHNRSDVTARFIETGRGYAQSSVVVRIPGQDPLLPAVLLGGHMDTYQNGKPGADDDGTGVGTVMEVYSAVLDSGLKFKRDIYFAFYAAEEVGLVGSQYVVADFQKRKIPVRAVLQFDMTGFRSPNDPQQIFFINDHVDVNLTRFLKQLTETYLKIPVQQMGETRCGYACSDHASWTDAGYPSAFPFEASFQNYNKTLHTSRDTLNILDVNHAMKFIKLGVAFAVENADPVQQ